MKSGWILIVIILALGLWSTMAASQQPGYADLESLPTLSMAEDCYALPYVDDRGIKIGSRGQISKRPLNGYVPLRTLPQGGDVLVQMHPDDTFTVLTGPECWQPYRISSGAVAHRAWYVRHDASASKGWVTEDEWMMMRVWNIELANSRPVQEETQATLPQTFNGQLQEISVMDKLQKPELAAIWQDDHRLQIDHAAYFSFELQTEPESMSAPDRQVLEDNQACRILVLIQAETAQPPLYAVLTDGHLHDTFVGDVQNLWLEADTYVLHVQFNYVTLDASGNDYQSAVCTQTDYTLTVKAA